MRKTFMVLAAILLSAFFFAPGAQASHPGTGSVSVTHGFKWTPNPGANTWFGALPNWCSFTGVGNDSQDNLIAISAGHCVANNNVGAKIYAYNNNLPAPFNQPIGELVRKNDANQPFDYAVFKLYPDKVTMHQNLANPASRVDAVGVPTVGQQVCKVGATTGKSCGTVQSVNAQNGDVITTTMDAGGGDSGAGLIVTGADDVIAILRGPVQACPFFCPVTGTLYKSLPAALADIPAGTPGAGFVYTVNP